MNDSKSSLVSWTLLRILADFNSAMVWMAPILPLIFIFTESFFGSFETVSNFKLQLIPPSLSYSTAFSSVWQDLSIWLSFRFLLVIHWNDKIHKMTSFFFVFNSKSDMLGEDLVICLYLKVSENFMRLSFLDKFWFVQIAGVGVESGFKFKINR